MLREGSPGMDGLGSPGGIHGGIHGGMGLEAKEGPHEPSPCVSGPCLGITEVGKPL